MEQNTLAVSSAAQSITPHRQATDVAKLCKEIVTKTAQNIQGRKYVRVEGWQSIANAFGCVASAKNVTRCETGITAVGQVRNMATGIVIAEAEGFVGFSEKTWGNREEYAQRAMAQTRAISRACRSAFAFVVTMMDAGLETTPAEEVPSEGFSDNHRQAPRVVDAEVIDPRIVSRELVSGETKYSAPEHKKKPVAQPEDGADWKKARFIKANRQDKTSKAGKPFVKWGTFIEIEGSEKAVWANTINRDLGETIDAMQDGESVLIQVNETQYGLDLVGIRSSDVPNKIQVENDDAADLDEIPF
jgi:hypothetical protein